MVRLIAPYSIKGVSNATMDECVNYLADVNMLCVDVETTGLCPHTNKVIMLQVGTVDRQYIIDTRHVDPEPLRQILMGPAVKVGTNIGFDYKMILGNFGIRMFNLVDISLNETILLCGHTFMKGMLSLQGLAKKYLDIHLPKDVRLEFLTLKDKKFNKRQIQYGQYDVIYPLQIYSKQYSSLKEKDLVKVHSLESKFLEVVAEMEFNGMFVHKEKWIRIAEMNEVESKNALERLTDFLVKNKLYEFCNPPDLFSDKITASINWNSTAQVVRLFKRLKVPTSILDRKKSREYGFDVFKDTVGRIDMLQYEEKYPIVKLYLDYKRYEKAVNTFGKNWLEQHINPTTNRVHTRFRQVLNTGRISSMGPNVQQIPSFKSKEKKSYEAHRTAFVAPEGKVLVVRDYSGQELRILADVSDEKSMVDEFVNGSGDIHSLTAAGVFGTKVSKTENNHLRQKGKTINFAIAYGASGAKIAKGIDEPVSKGEEIISNFYKTYPSLKSYFDEGHRFSKKNGYILIDPVTRRRSYFDFFKKYIELCNKIAEWKEIKKYWFELDMPEPGPLDKSIWADFFLYKGAMERKSQNFRIQGLAASMTKLVLVEYFDYIKKNSLYDKVKIILALHDEIVLEVDEDIAEEANEVLQHHMIKAGKVFCPKVPMVSDGGLTYVWDH